MGSPDGLSHFWHVALAHTNVRSLPALMKGLRNVVQGSDLTHAARQCVTCTGQAVWQPHL